jgi:hypothetical protein
VSSATAPRRRPWRQRAVAVPATLTLLACVLLGTVGWFLLAGRLI